MMLSSLKLAELQEVSGGGTSLTRREHPGMVSNGIIIIPHFVEIGLKKLKGHIDMQARKVLSDYNY
jgi:hypothetical protein